MKIRNATINDLKELAKIEAKCFPSEEAATEEDFKARLKVYPNYFWILEDDFGKIISFVNGMVAGSKNLIDEMFENPNLHDKNGDWQMIFGVNTLPEYRKNGYAGLLLKQVIKDAKKQKRKGVVLTCKEKLVNYYEKFGFRSYGISESLHGGAVWYDMRIDF